MPKYTTYIGHNGKEITAFITKDGEFDGYIEPPYNNSNSEMITNIPEGIQEYLKGSSILLIVQQTGDNYIVMIGDHLPYGHPDAGEEIFVCHAEAQSNNYISALNKLNKSLQDLEKDQNLRSNKVLIRTAGTYNYEITN